MDRLPIDILFFEPWYGGSHRAFAESWVRSSRNRVEVMSLAPRHWKWRQEASAWEFAAQVTAQRTPPDVIACSDYVDLPRLIGTLPPNWRGLPTLCYFHENQLTYPGEHGERDLTHGFCNVLTAVRADALVFNSAFHRDDFGAAADDMLSHMPRPNPRAQLTVALERASVVPPLPELAAVPLGSGGPAGAPLRIAFPHRLEHDKDPLGFLSIIREALDRELPIEVTFLGGDPSAAPSEVRRQLESIARVVTHVGVVPSRGDYLARLGACDIVASTARHEFFGVAFAEGMAAGCAPLAPDRLNYPALLARYESRDTGAGLAADREDFLGRLVRLAAARDRLRSTERREAARQAVLPLDASRTTEALDAIVEGLMTGTAARH